MLDRFIGKKRVLLISAEWLNTVAAILNNIASSNGTIKAKIEGDLAGSNLDLQIDPKNTAAALKDQLAANFICKGDRALLGEGLKWSQEGLTIDKDWFRQQVIQGEKN